MALILGGTILWDANSADEATELARIREMYIPEIILAYNTVLHTAGSIISRQGLIESMDLSVTLAAEENKNLTEVIVKAGRMRELVRSFAASGKSMLILKDAGKEWKAKKDLEGKDLGMWDFGPQVMLRGTEGLDVMGEDGMEMDDDQGRL
jgi:nuclear pore complex protein Nup107